MPQYQQHILPKSSTKNRRISLSSLDPVTSLQREINLCQAGTSNYFTTNPSFAVNSFRQLACVDSQPVTQATKTLQQKTLRTSVRKSLSFTTTLQMYDAVILHAFWYKQPSHMFSGHKWQFHCWGSGWAIRESVCMRALRTHDKDHLACLLWHWSSLWLVLHG